MLATIDRMIEEHHLLKHPFYTKWVEGILPLEAIQEYARQYFGFESEFPRFLSGIHTRSGSPLVRQALLLNLWDEEHGDENHVELWLRFAEAVGAPRNEVTTARLNPGTVSLVETYQACSRSVASGVAAIHAYEAQVPEVAQAKIDGLRRHYGITSGPALRFWEVHKALDVEHSAAERRVLAEVAADDPEPAFKATQAALDAWWAFLDSVDMACA